MYVRSASVSSLVSATDSLNNHGRSGQSSTLTLFAPLSPAGISLGEGSVSHIQGQEGKGQGVKDTSPPVTAKKQRSRGWPVCCRQISYAMCLLVSIATISWTLQLGTRASSGTCVTWLVTSLLALAVSFCVLEPLRVGPQSTLLLQRNIA